MAAKVSLGIGPWQLGAGLLLALALIWLWYSLSVEARRPASTDIVLVEEAAPPAAGPAALPAVDDAGPRLRLGFAGDIMQHRAQADDDFAASYAGIAPILRGFDLALGNLEFPVHPGRPLGPPPNSVQFNGSPAHLDALAGAGFDLLSQANNHVFDQGLEGALRTRAELEARGLIGLGVGASPAEIGPRVVEVKGVRLAFVAYTFPPNYYEDKTGKPSYWARDWPIHALNFEDWTGPYRAQGQSLFAEHVAAAQAQGAEMLIALVHWGREWHYQPSADQRRAAHDMIEAGIGLVVGSQSHVLGPPEVYRDGLIAYSLGNLNSDFVPAEVRLGALLEVTLTRRRDRLALTGFRYLPVVSEREGHRVTLLEDAAAPEAGELRRLAARILGPAAGVGGEQTAAAPGAR
ncbi:MAG: CapA family protein [Kiloniellales bacterium]|nr:CapA family protein [Kiloniellales bacterium]